MAVKVPMTARKRCAWFGRCLAGLLAGGLLLPETARADTVALTPAADAEIQQFSPSSNFGSLPSAVSGALGTSANHEIRRALLRFDLSTSVPAGSTINSATLQVQVVKVPAIPVNSTFDLRRVLRNWSESGVSWNFPVTVSAPWGTPGATGAADSIAAASSSVFVSGLGAYLFPSGANLTADVQAWANDPGTNFGWLLISEDEVSYRTARHFGARESVTNAPVLTIDFTPPPLTITTQPQDQTVPIGGAALMTVAASGAPPLTYLWQFNGSDLPQETNAFLILNDVQTNQAGVYTVVVRNPAGFTVSRPATLAVVPPAAPLPAVAFITPAMGQTFAAGADVPVSVSAIATASNAAISQVAIFLDTNMVGESLTPPFGVTLGNVPLGLHFLFAVATDSVGSSNAAISFLRVVQLPGIAITNPVDGQSFPLGATIPVAVALSNSVVPISQVVLFANDLEIAQLLPPTNLFDWQPALAGDYVLTAVALGLGGLSVTSAPVSIRVFTPETTSPTLHITSGPRNFARLKSPLVTLAGTAGDAVGVDRVEFQVGTGGFQQASGTNSWTAQFLLPAGTSRVRVRSVNLAGISSRFISRFYTYVVRSPLTVRVEGQGKVRPAWDGKLLEVGKGYRLRAKPAPGQIFAEWIGAPYQGPLLSFTMSSNLVLTARFVPNPFFAAQGAYAGLVLNTNAPTPESTGSFTLRLGAYGAFTGKLMLGGSTSSFQGRFDPEGSARCAALRRSLPPVALTLNLDLTSGAIVLRGTATDGSWTSTLTGSRSEPASAKASRRGLRSTPSSTGARTWALRFLDPTGAPAASGWVRITRSGIAFLAGTLPDGRRFSAATRIGAEGRATFVVFSSRGAVLAGTLGFGPGAMAPVRGAAHWIQSTPERNVTWLSISAAQ
jgi:hypothetical protein